jgi:hypothetical protein
VEFLNHEGHKGNAEEPSQTMREPDARGAKPAIYETGSRIVNSVPLSGVLDTEIDPP